MLKDKGCCTRLVQLTILGATVPRPCISSFPNSIWERNCQRNSIAAEKSPGKPPRNELIKRQSVPASPPYPSTSTVIIDGKSLAGFGPA